MNAKPNVGLEHINREITMVLILINTIFLMFIFERDRVKMGGWGREKGRHRI